MKTNSELRTHRRRVVIYCRISDDRESKRNGVDRQEAVCRERAERNGWDVVAVLIENDVSAYSGKRRPKYLELIRMLQADEADAVLALSGKRLQRDYTEAFAFLDLVEAKDIRVETIKAGDYNLNTAEGRGRARRAAIDAQEESEEIGERVKAAKADNIARGEYRGGPRPFGYEADGMTPRTLECPACPAPRGFSVERECRACGAAAVNAQGSEAWWVDWATDQALARRSLRSICVDLKAAGIKTVARRGRDAEGNRTPAQAHDWRPETLKPMLLRARNAGLLEVGGEVVGRASWPGVTTEDKWRACKALLTDPARRTSPDGGPTRTWLGTNLFRCGGEGCTDPVSTNGGYKLGIKYRHLGHVSRDAEAVDALVGEVVVRRLSRADASDLLRPPAKDDGRDLVAEANVLREKLDSFAADYADDLITRTQMLDGTARTRAKLAGVEREMGMRAAPPVLAGVPVGQPVEQVRAAWDGYDVDRKRSIIGALCTVTILRTGGGRLPWIEIGGERYRLDPESVRIEWK